MVVPNNLNRASSSKIRSSKLSQDISLSDQFSQKRPLDWFNILFVVAFPMVAITAAAWYAVEFGITWREVTASIVIWVFTGLGITAGYHRLFSHKGYNAHPAVRAVLAVLGAAACQNSAIAWCSDHRFHHSETDTKGDPYDATQGFFYSHMGWIFYKGLRGDTYDNVPDLRRDPVLVWQHKHWLSIAVVTNLGFIAIAALMLGNWLGMALIAGLLRIVVVQHFTFCVNSLAHIWGSQPYSHKTTSRDNWALSLITLGEGYHNYHHSFEWDYRNGPRWFNWDPTKWLIWSLSKLRLADSLRKVPLDVVLQRRFDQGRSGFIERLTEWSEARAKEWRALREDRYEQIRDRHEEFIDGLRKGQMALRDQLLSAEAALELELQELKAQRQALADVLRRLASETSEELRKALEHELRQLRRALRDAQRSARSSLKSWEVLLGEYRQGLSLLSAPA
jgi:stearoyl-CoA desaturase (Delta-9 desaturase)